MFLLKSILIFLTIQYSTQTALISNKNLISNETLPQSNNKTTTTPKPSSSLLTIIAPLPLIQNGDDTEALCKDFVESSSTNEFSSPNYPNEYFHGINCVKVISAGEGQVIRLRFLDHFHIEPDDKCQYDYLDVRDGQYGYSTHIVKLCGTNPPSFIMSSGRHLWLHFTSDKDIHYVGFKASYEFIPSPNPRPDLDDCSFTLTSIEEEIKQLNITEEILTTRQQYSINYIDCTWKIEAPPNYQIMLQFLLEKDHGFKLEKANDCNYNVIEIYGTRTEYFGDDGIIKIFCGSESDGVYSKRNVMHFRFFTVLSQSGVGDVPSFGSLFSAYYTVYRNITAKGPDGKLLGSETCVPPEEFDCTDNTCIDKKLTCNEKPNCKQNNDEDKEFCNWGKAAFSMKMDLIVIAFIGCFLAAGMCSGLFLNICRKLRQDKMEMNEIRKIMLQAAIHGGAASKESIKHHEINEMPGPSSSSSVKKSIDSTTPPSRNINLSNKSTTASTDNNSDESKDTVVYKGNKFGFMFKPNNKIDEGSTNNTNTEIPYSPPPPYNPILLTKMNNKNPTKEEQETAESVIEVRDCSSQTKESFTESYLRDVYFKERKRAPLARTEAFEYNDNGNRMMKRNNNRNPDVLVYSNSVCSSVADASVGSVELISGVIDEDDEDDKNRGIVV